MSKAKNAFQEIDFGYASAQAEARENPDLLTRGYLDAFGLEEKVKDGKEWLVLGYKGSGKSAVAERFRLQHDDDPMTFVQLLNLEDFEFTRFIRLAPGKEPLETELPSIWSWLIYSFFLRSFFTDNGLRVQDENELVEIKSAFKKMGLSQVSDINEFVRASSEATFNLQIPNIAGGKWNRKSEPVDVDIRWYVLNLRPFISNLRSTSKHYVIIDGLDEILTSSQAQYSSLSALIFEANRLNEFLRINSVPAKLLVLCRTDMFELLQGANKNKIRQDYTIDLDWNTNPKTPHKSPLLSIANLRGENSLGRKVNVASEFLPRKIESRNSRKFLLDMTRHTPRDFLRLITYIQQSTTGGHADASEVRNGIREYSAKYFLPEIQDELQGYADYAEIHGICMAIENIASRDFTLGQLKASAKEVGWEVDDANLLKILRALYECSGIGNVRAAKKGKRYLSFKYRNRLSNFKKSERIILHRGLWRAFNIQWTPFGSKIDPDISFYS